ncbi:MAG: prolipoprotein diacylglyceryl transferase, partial [Deltaproteobacteria bacterium]|nr:prolipoprotein diacylglyceryl transferase [Deltaproteobacteria bacterium]
MGSGAFGCFGPKVTSRGISTYTIAGFVGYLAANIVGTVLAIVWQLTLVERLITVLAPPLAFVVVVTIASAIAGRERIVFYQTTCAGLLAVVVAGAIAGARVDRMLDIATLGIGTFLVFGRIGCLAVACCHGTLGRGVVYGPAHVAVGFWARWSGRPLWPVQAVESAASAALVIGALMLGSGPGDPTAIYLGGYAIVRFTLELVRGDGARPYAGGLSEAQWVALATTVAIAIWQPVPATVLAAGVVAVGSAIAIVTRRRRELFLPPHLRELDRLMEAATDGTRRETSRGVAISRHPLP